MDDFNIVREFNRRVRELFPGAEIYFYGSRATRTHHEDSDYDVLVLLDDINYKIRKRVYDIAWEVGFEHEALIAPVLVPRKEFYLSSASPFINNVKRHGVAL